MNVKLSLAKRIPISLVVGVTISLAAIWTVNKLVVNGGFCTSILGGTVYCGQIGVGNNPTNGEPSSPVLPTSTPPFSIADDGNGGCKISAQVSNKTDKIRIVVTSVSVEPININISHVTVHFEVENLTDYPLVLKIDGNVGISQTGKVGIVAAPEVEMSSPRIDLAPKEKQTARLSIDRIVDDIPRIDVAFRRMIFNEAPIDEGIYVSNIPVSCKG